MYAIFKSGGRQYQAQPGQIVKVEKLSGEVGESITINEVLLFSDDQQLQVGQPLVDGVLVRATIIGQERMPKIKIFKHKRRKDYRKRQGHRQAYTAVRVESIE